MADYAIYLRKSRADVEAETRGEGETLSRHREALRALAQRRGLHVVREYSELVTGDSIAARPQMQLLLDDVKRGLYAGVIVNDVDRLGRGDSIDQEIIKYTFVAGRCQIITPTRDIDPARPSDEDMLDFSMFFARFEYRKISQRLLQGRTRSAAAGNYISPRVPYGYRKVVDGKKISLVPDPDTAGIVRMIFGWYASKKYGYQAIASKLNEMGLKTCRGQPFGRATVKKMLTNPVYTGRIVWAKTSTISIIEDGTRKKKHVEGTPIIIENAHPAIIPDKLFESVQQMFRESRHASPTNTGTEITNPLAGLVYCAVCGKAMQIRGARKGRRNDKLMACMTPGCPTRGTYIGVILQAVLEIMRGWCTEYKEPSQTPEPEADSERQALLKQISTIEGQLTKAQELVELGVYAPSEYLRRKDELQGRIRAIQARLAERQTVASIKMETVVPGIERVLDVYPYAETAEEQNQLLKSVIARIDFHKTASATKSVDPATLMELTIYPRIVPE